MYAIVFHAHQKLDRVARRHLKLVTEDSFFPKIRQILKFEAGHGPDGTRLKRSPTGDQPWHFIDPHDEADTQLDDQIQHHYDGLVEALVQKDDIRASFEAAWMAHALVDGLTPAHHHPYERELEDLRGEHHTTRKGLSGRVYVKGDSLSQSLLQSFKLVGPKGLLTTHAMFEAGAYTLIAPLPLTKGKPTQAELNRVVKKGVPASFRSMAQEVASYKLYERFYASGWTRALSRDIRHELAPRMVKMITLAWYAACQDAKKQSS